MLAPVKDDRPSQRSGNSGEMSNGDMKPGFFRFDLRDEECTEDGATISGCSTAEKMGPTFVSMRDE